MFTRRNFVAAALATLTLPFAKAWGQAWGAAWGRVFAPTQQPAAGALAGDRAPADSKRPLDPATARLDALQTVTRIAQPDSQRPSSPDTERPTATAAPRAATSNTSRPAQAGSRRK